MTETFAQKKKALEEIQARAARELALMADEQRAVDELGPIFIEALKSFEAVMRGKAVAPERALVVAAAVHSNVLRFLLQACGSQTEDTAEEAERIAKLHADVHNLSALGKAMEKRLIEQSAVVGVGRMVIATPDISKGR